MCVTLQEIRQAIRDNILEKTPGFWTDAELNKAINAGYSDLLYVDPPITSVDITLTPGVDQYPLPNNLISVESVTVEGRDLPPYRYMLYPPYEGEPVGYQLAGDALRVIPKPDKAYTVTLRYAYEPPPLVADTDVPLLPERYHYLLILYGTFWALRKDGDPMYAAYQQEYASAKSQFANEVLSRQNHRASVVQDPTGMWW